ncbi:MAG TPA: ACT domain-containing protein [Gammaproteobacteria bacterium]|jgi:glycine cleavage system transcriptional repressor|nr:ACT domain-containing protein [Gammaproteobacteria bacterium]
MKQYLAISVLGKERPGLLREVTRAVLDSGCQVKDSRMTLLGEEFALQLLAGGSWNNIARLEAMLPRLEETLELEITAHRSHERPSRQELIPYAIDAIAADRAGIVHHLADFFIEREIQISEMSTRAYPAPQTGAPLFAIQMVVAIPTDTAIAALREEFMDLCDRINLDAIIEPMKN